MDERSSMVDVVVVADKLLAVTAVFITLDPFHFFHTHSRLAELGSPISGISRQTQRTSLERFPAEQAENSA